ncbi:complement C1q tumor necrosis factor-related protein 3-like [Mercenaria mercenaria]|uniref:complement C1q tumor necrosis factor-related protein 3-like n=1 Tax=Mercenaria mercenaria TaxID=6596 RepID=UPI00234E5A92|nr:complement C1q tumor necrosis factor-related protein 3-like [Mercenaria mercenaria]
MVETIKAIILAGVAITVVSVGSALGSYFMLKASLEEEVNEKFKQIHDEQPASSRNTAALQAQSNDHGENKSIKDSSQNDSGGVNQTPSAKDIEHLVSTVNRTLSKDIQYLHSMSQVLATKIDSDQQKLKLIEELIGRNGITALKGSTGMAAKTQLGLDAKKGKKDTSMRAPIKDEKQNKNPQGTSQNEKRVYFSVALTNTLENLGEKHVIIFDMVYSNEGFGYNTKTGQFNVPVTGTYLFMFFVEAINKEGKTAQVSLVVDGQNKATALAEAWHNGQDVTSANAAVTHLTKGQKAWIQTADSANKLNDIDKRKTTFTGVLLFS